VYGGMRDLEIIVVDDGSTDARRRCRRNGRRITYLGRRTAARRRRERRAAAGTRNLRERCSTSTILGSEDAGRLREMIAAPAVDIVCGLTHVSRWRASRESLHPDCSSAAPSSKKKTRGFRSVGTRRATAVSARRGLVFAPRGRNPLTSCRCPRCTTGARREPLATATVRETGYLAEIQDDRGPPARADVHVAPLRWAIPN